MQLAIAFVLALPLGVFAQSGGVAPLFGGGANQVTASLVSEVSRAAPGESFRIAVQLDHQEHWHTYGKVLPEGVIGKPTTLKFEVPEGWSVEELPWPETVEVDSTGGKKSEGYEGTVYLPARVTASASSPVGESVTILVKVDALVCDPQNCMPIKPEASLEIAVGASAIANTDSAGIFDAVMDEARSPDEAEDEEPQSWISLLFLAFLGGLILNVMPCVFPVLGIKVMGFVNQAGENRRMILWHGLAYTAGVLVCFWALGAVLIALQSGGADLGWGFQLQSPVFVFLLTFFLFMFALNMVGVFEVGSSAVGVGQELQNRSGLGGSFFSGLLATVVATPCAAPFLGPALGFAFTLPPVPTLLFFTVIGLGLSSPYLVLSLFPKWVSALPRPGAWMESFKQAMAFLLFGTSAYLLWSLEAMVGEEKLLWTFLAFAFVAFGCWVYGRWCLPHRKPVSRIVGGLVALLAIAGGLAKAWPGEEGKWEDWSPERVAELREKGTPVYVDYTARWCATCQVNKRVYDDPALVALIEAKGITLLKADWTNEDERITRALADLGKAAVPVNVLYVPSQDDPVILPELLTVDNVSEALGAIVD